MTCDASDCFSVYIFSDLIQVNIVCVSGKQKQKLTPTKVVKTKQKSTNSQFKK